MFTPSSCTDIGIRKFDFVVKTLVLRTGFKQNLENLPSAMFPCILVYLYSNLSDLSHPASDYLTISYLPINIQPIQKFNLICVTNFIHYH